MSLHHKLPEFSFESQELQGVVAQLGQTAMAMLDRRYGPNSDNPLEYHNAGHAYDVVEAAYAIWRALGDPRERHLANILIAGFYHDVERGLNGFGRNESASAEIAVAEMRKIGSPFKGKDQDEVRRATSNTVVSIVDGRIVKHADFKLGKILSDADLATLGRDRKKYEADAMNLRLEQGKRSALIGKELTEFALGQLVILTNYEPYFPQTAELFPHRLSNIAHMQSYLNTEAA